MEDYEPRALRNLDDLLSSPKYLLTTMGAYDATAIPQNVKLAIIACVVDADAKSLPSYYNVFPFLDVQKDEKNYKEMQAVQKEEIQALYDNARKVEQSLTSSALTLEEKMEELMDKGVTDMDAYQNQLDAIYDRIRQNSRILRDDVQRMKDNHYVANTQLYAEDNKDVILQVLDGLELPGVVLALWRLQRDLPEEAVAEMRNCLTSSIDIMPSVIRAQRTGDWTTRADGE